MDIYWVHSSSTGLKTCPLDDKALWSKFTHAEELLCMCTRCTVNRKAVDLPCTCLNGKGDFFIWEYSDDTECCSGIAYLPRTVIVNLPCKTKASKSSHSKPHSPYGLCISERKACSTSLDLAMPQYDPLVTFYAVVISVVHISGSPKIRYLQNDK